MSEKYSFAINRVKLEYAIKSLKDKKIIDPSIEINEVTVKEAYIKRGGLLQEEESKASTEEQSPEEEAPISKKGRKASTEE